MSRSVSTHCRDIRESEFCSWCLASKIAQISCPRKQADPHNHNEHNHDYADGVPPSRRYHHRKSTNDSADDTHSTDCCCPSTAFSHLTESRSQSRQSQTAQASGGHPHMFFLS